MRKIARYGLAALLAAGVFIAGLGVFVHRNLGDLPDESRFAHLPYYKNGGFVSPIAMASYPEKQTGKTGWLGYAGPSPGAPARPLPMVRLQAGDFAAPEAFAYYWLGHSSAILELNHQRILIDPVFDNAAPVPLLVPRYQPAPLARKALPDIDVVLITHDHYDHLEAATMRYLAAKARRFVVPLGVGARLQSWGVPADKISELGWGDDTVINDVTFTAERTNHYSARWINDRNKTLWAAYVIEGAGKRLFWAGDGGYGDQFLAFGRKYGGFDVAFVEIDGANAGWPNTHMFPEQSVQAVADLRANLLVPVHWGVFDLGIHPWDESIRRADRAAREKNIDMATPKMGEKFIPGKDKTDRWWENQAIEE